MSSAPNRWAKIVGWLLIIGAVGLSLASLTGSMSEREMIEMSLYPVLAFGFGIGLLVGARWMRDVADPSRAPIGVLLAGLIGAGVAAFGRWYFFVKIFDRL